jgi:hypothetical protein
MARRRLKKAVKKKREMKGKRKGKKGRTGKDRPDKDGKGPKKKGPARQASYKVRNVKMVLGVLAAVLIILIAIFAVQHYYKPEREDWTVMIYMAGDNSLSPIVNQNLEAMEKVGSNDILDIVVLTDESGDQDSHLYHVKKDRLEELPISSIRLSGLNEVDTGKPDTLSDFGRYTLDNYPSDNYMLIMWGHGKGWQGLATDKGGSELTMPEFRAALNDIKDANDGRKLDVMGFDACAMATIEGFYEMSEYADILVASQKKEPDAGWPYEPILKDIATGKDASPEDIARSIVKKYVHAYEEGDLPHQDFTVGMTAIRTRTDSDLYISFQRFADTLNTLPVNERDQILGLQGKLETYEDPDSVNLVDLIAAIETEIEMTDQMRLAISDLHLALDSAVLKEEHWNNPASDIIIEAGGGISIYFPKNTVDLDYKDTGLSHACSWDEFLEK